jgi:hypothetical protein
MNSVRPRGVCNCWATRAADDRRHPALRGGHRRGHARGQSCWRQCTCHRQGPFRGHQKAADAKAQLDGVLAEARRDIGYIFSRAQWLRREHKATEAAELMLSVPKRSVETTAAALGRKIQNLYAGSESAEAAEVNGACHLFSITRASARTGHTHVELELPPHYFGSGGYSLPIEKDNFETV